jgi:TonB family protein
MCLDSIKHSGRTSDQFRAPRTGAGAGVILVILTLYSLVLGQQGASDYQVEATYLYNFAKSAQWPEEALPHASSPIVIGVVGADDEFIATMKRTLAGKTVGTHPVVVERASTADELKGCTEILIRKSAGRKRTQAVISDVADENILLVGEDETFLQQGGMINMVLKDGGVQFAVDGASLDRAKIRLSKELLALATLQRTSSDGVIGESRRLKFSPAPEYPVIARKMNIKGSVLLEVSIRPDGTVKDAKILGGHPALADAALKAVMKWSYEPASKTSVVVVRLAFE